MAEPRTDIAARFARLFDGLDRVRGSYSPPGPADHRGKRKGEAKTVQGAPDKAAWERHLSGSEGLGVVPIRDDATVSFGAIDIDEYDLDIPALWRQINELGLPLLLCRTKSGGAHLYLFTRTSVPAALARDRLMRWAMDLGRPNVEVFPKQIKLSSRNDNGSWINVPYFNLDQTERYCVVGERKLSAEEFLDLAEECAVDEENLEQDTRSSEASPPDHDHGGSLEGAPPCLQTLARSGFPEGTRNSGLFNFGIYLQLRFGDDWEGKLDEYNQAFMDPPLGHREVAEIAKHLKRKRYFYKCKDQPICGACNKQICLDREFGIGESSDEPGVNFGQMVVLDGAEPLFIWEINGIDVEFDANTLVHYGPAKTTIFLMTKKLVRPMKQTTWERIVQRSVDEARYGEAPPEASKDGQVVGLLREFCTGRAKAATREELLLDRPWDAEDGKTYFVAEGFRSFLESRRVKVTPSDMWKTLRRAGADTRFFNIKGKGLHTWSIPTFEDQKEPFSVPKTETDEDI